MEDETHRLVRHSPMDDRRHLMADALVRRRSIAAVLLLVAGCLLAPAAVVGAWARTQLTDTARYVETVSPLAADAEIQNAVADRLTEVIVGALPDRLANGTRSFVRDRLGTFVRTDLFQTLWRETNRVAHEQLIAALNGSGAITDDMVGIELGPFVAAARDSLVSSGFGAAERIPDVHRSFELFSVQELERAQSGFRLLNRYGLVLPFVTVVLLALGVFVATDRRRALVGTGLGLALSMAALAVVLAIARNHYLDRLPSNLTPSTASAVADIMIRSLWVTLATVFTLGLIVGGAAFLARRRA
jgi:hypothetical protein